ncbi:MAG: divalent-cation tolerance protein CutA [Burkholderiales bacterium]|nr:divalent-cation tolerance protein CutA [Burkholderiales bacterium]
MTTMPEDLLAVLCNAPDLDCARAIAERLVADRLAACVNILAPCTSIYRWQGSIESAQEIPVLAKTTRALYARVESTIVALHPYEVPEIIALPIAAGLPAYLGWVVTETN